MNLWSIFAAGRLRRWHAHPVMSNTDDRLDGHQGRVARIALALFPGDQDLLAAALTHDDGELADIPNPVKNRLSDGARAELNALEAARIVDIWGGAFALSDDQAARLKLCDMLDAMMWTGFHSGHLLADAGWQRDIAQIQALAIMFGAADKVWPIIAGFVIGRPQ